VRCAQHSSKQASKQAKQAGEQAKQAGEQASKLASRRALAAKIGLLWLCVLGKTRGGQMRFCVRVH